MHHYFTLLRLISPQISSPRQLSLYQTSVLRTLSCLCLELYLNFLYLKLSQFLTLSPLQIPDREANYTPGSHLAYKKGALHLQYFTVF